MGKAQEVFSRAAGWNAGAAAERFPEDTERNLLDCAERAAWRDLPERYGPWQTVYKRFVEWQKSGLIEKIFHELGEDADLEDISMDSTYIKAHKASAGAEREGGR